MEAAAPLTLPHCPLTRSPPHTLTPPAGLAELRKCTVRDLLFADPQLLRLLGSSLPARPVRRCVCWGGGGQGRGGAGAGEGARARACACVQCAARLRRGTPSTAAHATPTRTHARPPPMQELLVELSELLGITLRALATNVLPHVRMGRSRLRSVVVGGGAGRGGGARGLGGGAGGRPPHRPACMRACMPTIARGRTLPPPSPQVLPAMVAEGDQSGVEALAAQAGLEPRCVMRDHAHQVGGEGLWGGCCRATLKRGWHAPRSSGVGMRHAHAGWACASGGCPQTPPPPPPRWWRASFTRGGHSALTQ